MFQCKRSLVTLVLLVAGLAPMAAVAQETAFLTVVHGVPDATVDVCLDAGSTGSFSKIATDLEYTDVVSNEVPMGSHELRWVNAGGDCRTDAIDGLSATVMLLPNMDVSMVAGLAADGLAFTTTLFVNDTTQLTFGRELVVRHVAAAPALDFRYGRIFPRTRIEGLEFGADVSKSMFGGLLRTDVTLAGQTSRVQGPDLLRLNRRQSTVVYIVGSTDDGTIAQAVQRIDRRNRPAVLDVEASFVPTQPAPGPNSVSMAEGLAFGPFVVIDVEVTDTAGIFGAAFDFTFDPQIMLFASWAPGTVLEQGGDPVTYAVATTEAGRLTIVATRLGPVGTVDVVGTATLLRLTFVVTQAGTSDVQFDGEDLLDDLGFPIVGITWSGGTLEAN